MGSWLPARLNRVQTCEEVGQPAQGLFGLLQTVPAELELLPVVRRQQQIAERRRAKAAIEHVFHVEDVAQRLRHLLLVDLQVLDVDPEA